MGGILSMVPLRSVPPPPGSLGRAAAGPDEQSAWILEQAVLAGVALLAVLAPLSGWLLQTFRTLCHELGHALASWLFARPALPAFDLTHGGGVTLIRDRWLLLVLLVGACWVWLLRLVWSSRCLAGLVGAMMAAWGLILLTGTDEPLIIAMGHGGTVVFGTVFLARGMTGDGTAHGLDRRLSAVVGWSLLWNEGAFAWGVLLDPAQRQLYCAGKGGMDNDAVRLAGIWGCGLPILLWPYLLAVLPVGAGGALAWWRWRGRPLPSWRHP